jgi:peptidyl-prolyl cis-trans isomerase A (cyclophilin A)
MKNYLALSAIGVCSFLTACGGGGGTTPTPTPTNNATITSITPDKLMYGQQTRFTVVGTGLANGVTLTSNGCSATGSVAGGSATQQVITCKIAATGSVNFNFLPAGNTTATANTQTILEPRVTMKTSLGDMVIELNPTKAPITVNNFLQYVSENFYNNLIFHRVLANFVIQGGGFNVALTEAATRAPIKLESRNGLSNLRGTIAMARTPIADSATGQFYFNTVDNVALDGTVAGFDGYAVFGKIITGLDVMDKIRVVPTRFVNANLDVVPVTPVVITSVTQTQ